MANGGTGILGASTLSTGSFESVTPAGARRTWPQWLALGLALVAVAVVSVLWEAGGARLLLGALGAFFAVRGAALVRTAGALTGELAGRARALGTGALLGGAAATVVALASAGVAARVLLVAVPVVLLGAAAALLARGRVARRGGLALLVWSVLVTGVLVATGLAQDWERAAGVATVVSALAVAGLGVPLLVGAMNLRAIAARPAPARPAPSRPAGCGGCACGAGGCGS